MKKLLIAMAVAGVAFCVNAASVNWAVEGIQTTGDFDSGEGNYAAGYLVYLFDNSGTYTRSAMAGLLADAASGDATWKTALGASLANVVANASGGLSKSNIAVADGDFTGYMVILDAGTVDAAQYAFITGTYTVNDNSMHKMDFGDLDGDGYVDALDYSTAGQSGSNWVAVPEPTSGLMLLLGMAGLALRRRRA